MDGKTKNKLKAIASEKNINTNVMLNFYYMEQFARRIAVSSDRNKIILKGGFLISHLSNDFFRSTKDIDATLRDIKFNEDEIVKIFTNICAIDINDGINFEFYKIEMNQQEKEYGGFKVKVQYGKKQLVKFDISCGEAIYPEIETNPIQSFLGDTIDILSYPIETIIAEKFESVLSNGAENTRMKDFGDLYTILKVYDLDFTQVKEAIKRTCINRNTYEKLYEIENILIEKATIEKIRGDWPNYIVEEPTFIDVTFEEIINEINRFVENLNFIENSEEYNR